MEENSMLERYSAEERSNIILAVKCIFAGAILIGGAIAVWYGADWLQVTYPNEITYYASAGSMGHGTEGYRDYGADIKFFTLPFLLFGVVALVVGIGSLFTGIFPNWKFWNKKI
jgi:hypothetical protein